MARSSLRLRSGETCLGNESFFVDRDSLGGPCADTNAGTRAQPWCTVAQANTALNGGQTVFIRAGTYTGETIAPTRSGTGEGNRITYTNYADEVVTFTGSVYCVRLQSRSYLA